MDKNEIRKKIDGLSARARFWLHHAEQALDEGEKYIDHPASRAECRLAGLIIQKRFGYIEIPAEVRQVLYVEQYAIKKRKGESGGSKSW